jgi:hypothetical protein
LSFVISAVDGLFIILSGAAVVSGLVASDDVEPDGAPDVDGGVLELVDGGDAGLIVELDDVEVDDFVSELGAGAEDELEGAGVTTGGVVDVVVFDSR